MSKSIISIKNISKHYKIGADKSKYKTISEDLLSFFKPKKAKIFKAIDEISLEINKGDSVAIIGNNGAGKSTLLKLISGISYPSSGSIKINGSIATLLEVGTGFHPELTGKENIYLYGSILGMTYKEINSKFNEIVEFSGVKDFLNTPVKRYSSGMYVRLAFSVAAHLDSDILIVDEVLAVGDAQFQKKCLEKLDNISSESGRTILFVTHNMAAAKNLCNKAILLKNGKIVSSGHMDKVISDYFGSSSTILIPFNPELKFNVKSISLLDNFGNETMIYKPKDTIRIKVEFYSSVEIENPNFWVDITGPNGGIASANMFFLEKRTCNKISIGDGYFVCNIENLYLLPQIYSISIRFFDSNAVRIIPSLINVCTFQISGNVGIDYLMDSPFASQFFDHDTPLISNFNFFLTNNNKI